MGEKRWGAEEREGAPFLSYWVEASARVMAALLQGMLCLSLEVRHVSPVSRVS
jgi:hypothetical protein